MTGLLARVGSVEWGRPAFLTWTRPLPEHPFVLKTLEQELADVISAAYPLAAEIVRSTPAFDLEPDAELIRLTRAVDNARFDVLATPWLGRVIVERCITPWEIKGLVNHLEDLRRRPWKRPEEALATRLARCPPHHPGEMFEKLMRRLRGL